MFQTHVASVSSGYCKSRSRCCICCYGYTWTFQAYIFKCFICFKRMLQVFHLYVSKVDLREHMFQWRRWLADSCLLVVGALSWVTVRGHLWPADASAVCIRRQCMWRDHVGLGKWARVWDGLLGRGAWCSAGCGHWMGCRLGWCDAVQYNARELCPDFGR
jgi:hypothetical protein